MKLNKEKLAKNTSNYQNLFIFSWASINFFKKMKNNLKSSLILFLSLWLIPHKIAVKKNLQRNLQIMSSNTKLKKIK